jgi:Fur family zinc uptake transcriptional regulator
MNKLDTTIRHAEQQCKVHGTRLTDKRKQVLTGLLKSEKALSAYELVDLCKKEFGETIPAMTVYRILDFLEEENLAHKLKIANKYVACSHIPCDHNHQPQFLICTQCLKVEEISIDNAIIQALEKSVKQAGFQVVNSKLEMDCVCDECKEAAIKPANIRSKLKV